MWVPTIEDTKEKSSVQNGIRLKVHGTATHVHKVSPTP